MKKEKKKIKVQICPQCKSQNIRLYMGGILGIQYKCNNCGYVGPLIIEKDLDES